VKLKQEEYVRLHRIVTGLSEKSVWEHMSEGKPLEDMLGELPDELHNWTRQVWGDLADRTDALHADAKRTHGYILDDMPGGWTRKDYAQAAQRHPEVRPYLFNILDGRDPRPGILRTLKPVGDTHARAFSEAVA
jgi:RNA ligase